MPTGDGMRQVMESIRAAIQRGWERARVDPDAHALPPVLPPAPEPAAPEPPDPPREAPQFIVFDGSPPMEFWTSWRVNPLTDDEYAEWRRREEERLREFNEAQERSRVLLCAALSAQQLFEFGQHQYFTVIGGYSGNTYQIRPNTVYNIDLMRGKKRHAMICAGPHPMLGLPVYDQMLAQKLYLEGDERAFMQEVNMVLVSGDGEAGTVLQSRANVMAFLDTPRSRRERIRSFFIPNPVA